MPSYWTIVNHVIYDADVLLILLDARLIDETRNQEIEDKVMELNKPLIYVVTKSDLVAKEIVEDGKKHFKPSVFISSRNRQGLQRLRERIIIEAKKAGVRGIITVGVLGYPNVGKSSLINALKGRKSAPTSILSGYTKGVQKVKADNRIMMLDTPGVIPYKEKDFMKHAQIGTLDFTKTQEPDLVVMELMEKFPGMIEKHYGVNILEDKEDTIDNIALKKNILKKGGIADTVRTAREILKDWQKGVIR